MVTSVTSLGRSGLFDWMAQRLSALILLAWTLYLAARLLLAQELDYASWRALFDAPSMRIFSLIALLSLCAHAWIGVWTVTTDYLNTAHFGRAGTAVRLLTQAACALLTLAYLLWGARIFWGG
ncbi:MAG: succinate dehydrogenase, hydrophobic membrane anchor protein [Gammaproteobacteria bacterium]|nr:succinate dehydrogenase, hydrophobic membrane anchor protein [Gammaproteobacteria bacterium]